MIKTILVATDGSNHARKAVELASDMAATYGARLIVLHVARRGDPPDRDSPLAQAGHLVGPPAGAAARLWRLRGEHVLAEAAQAAKRRGVGDVHTAVCDGDPAARIVRRAEREAADLIVLGSRGLGGLRSLLLGSVSRRVCELARCPCVVVK